MAQFTPNIEVQGPKATSKKDHLGTVRIDVGARRIHVLFYDDGHVRFRINESPMLIYESYLRGGQKDFTIIGLRPDSLAVAVPDEAVDE